MTAPELVQILRDEARYRQSGGFYDDRDEIDYRIGVALESLAETIEKRAS